MQCPRCRADNSEGRFCAECGASLGQACPACGFANESFVGSSGNRVAETMREGPGRTLTEGLDTPDLKKAKALLDEPA